MFKKHISNDGKEMKTAWQNCSLFSIGLSRWLSGKEFECQTGDTGSICGLGGSPGKEMQPIPVFLSGKSHEQRSLVGYSSWSHKRVGHNLATKQTIFSIKMSSLGLMDECNWFIKRKVTKEEKFVFHEYKNKAKSLICKHLLQINNKKSTKPHKAIPQERFKWRTHMLFRNTHVHMRHMLASIYIQWGLSWLSFKSMGLCVRQYGVDKINYSSCEDICAIEILATPLVSQMEKSHPRATEKSSCQR